MSFIYDNAEPSELWGTIKEQTHSYMATRETVDLALSDLIAGYTGLEKFKDFFSQVIPFETMEDNLDMVDSVFKGGNLGKLHRKFWSSGASYDGYRCWPS